MCCITVSMQTVLPRLFQSPQKHFFAGQSAASNRYLLFKNPATPADGPLIAVPQDVLFAY
jgi:hypothetical protein